MNNSGEGRRRPPRRDTDPWLAFEELPKAVRTALASADYNWHPGWILGAPPAAAIAEIRRADLEEHSFVARRDRRAVYYRGGIARP
ncbi:DUF6525 family protein [Xanthobacteraceae bacterium A53D]